MLDIVEQKIDLKATEHLERFPLCWFVFAF